MCVLGPLQKVTDFSKGWMDYGWWPLDSSIHVGLLHMTFLISFRRLAITSVKIEIWVSKKGFPQRVEASLLLFSHWVFSDSLRPHGLQHSRLSCPSPFPKFCSGSCPLSWLLWCSVTKSCPNSLQFHELQHTRLPCPSLSPWVCSISYPLNQWCHPITLPSIAPFSSSSQSSPGLGSFLISRFFTSGGQRAEASASVPQMNIQDWFPLGLTVWSPCCPVDSQKSSPALQFVNINSSALILHYGPTLTSIRDYWKNHSFDYTNLCLKSYVFALWYAF